MPTMLTCFWQCVRIEPRTPLAAVFATLAIIPIAIYGATEVAEAKDLIAKLGAKSFAQRSAAARELEGNGSRFLREILEASRTDVDPEVRRSASAIADRLDRKLFFQLGAFHARRAVAHDTAHFQAIGSANGKWLLTAGMTHLYLWNVPGTRLVRVFGSGEVLEFDTLALSEDALFAAAGGGARRVRVWSTMNGEELHRTERLPSDAIALTFVESDKILHIVCKDGSLHKLDVGTKHAHHVKVADLRLSAGAYCVGRGVMVIAGIDADGRNKVAFVSMRRDSISGEMLVLGDGQIMSAGFSPDGKLVAMIESNERVHIVDVDARARIGILHHRGVSCVCFAADSRRIISCGDRGDTTIQVWDARNGTLLHRREEKSPYLATTVLRTTNSIATTHRDGEIRLWQLSE